MGRIVKRKMIRYIVVLDLIINGGERCTFLKKKPGMDHITIEVNDYIASYTRCIMITYDNNKCLVFREMKVDRFMNPEKSIADDLDNACMELFRYKMCRGCKHLQQDWTTVPCNRCCGYDKDSWAEKSEDNKMSITNETGIIFTNVGKEICHSLPNESFDNFIFRLGLGWFYKYE